MSTWVWCSCHVTPVTQTTMLLSIKEANKLRSIWSLIPITSHHLYLVWMNFTWMRDWKPTQLVNTSMWLWPVPDLTSSKWLIPNTQALMWVHEKNKEKLHATSVAEMHLTSSHEPDGSVWFTSESDSFIGANRGHWLCVWLFLLELLHHPQDTETSRHVSVHRLSHLACSWQHMP